MFFIFCGILFNKFMIAPRYHFPVCFIMFIFGFSLDFCFLVFYFCYLYENMGFLMFIWVFYFRYHLTLLCLFPPFFFAFWKKISGLVGRKISSSGISARNFFCCY